jgi:DNA-directed RNA polymerase alpha subunit
MEPLLQKHYDRKIDQFNEAMTTLRDHILLNDKDCKQVLRVINDQLPGMSSDIGHCLRRVLILSIDVQATEDALVKLKGLKD